LSSNLIDMPADLDIAPLRSFVAVADCGGFQRAADHLHLSQAAVSQHVRRLEGALGQPLVERAGRGSRFTVAGDALLARARTLLSLHDETIAAFTTPSLPVVTVGSTEHAAAQLLPALAAALESASPGHRFRFRIDRGGRLRDGLTARTVDLALLFQPTDSTSVPVGSLELTWFAAPSFTLPGDAVPLVAFDNPCALRTRALETLAAADLPAVVGAEATQLAGVQAAVGAGLGVALLATLGTVPAGLAPYPALPEPEPLPLYVCARPGLEPSVVEDAAAAVRPLLGGVLL
jgi:DNA-binding transcriptional LysR family regulator